MVEDELRIPKADKPGNGKPKLQRALIIGLGGCGAEVIKGVRRLLIDQFGRFENIPIVKFLYIDTDITPLQEMSSMVEKDIILSQAEQVDVEVADASGLYRNIRKGHSPHYAWFNLDKLQGFSTIANGAGKIRQLGRLCFWIHQNVIRQKMESLIQDLNADANSRFMHDRYQIDVEPGINIHIIAGLAGGTGSGMFLDAAYLARHIVQQRVSNADNQSAGYLIMPEAFKDLASPYSMPNGYAALKELSYLFYIYKPDADMANVFGKPLWLADYTGKETDRVQFENVPPFDHCYLLENRNPYVQLHRRDVFAMIARSLFHEFTLAFAGHKRTLRANIQKNTTRNDGLDCPARFMSFGQSAVFLPRREITKILQHHLALQAVQEWIDKQAAPFAGSTESVDKAGESKSIEAAVTSLKAQAEKPELVEAARAYAIREIFPGLNLLPQPVVNSVLAEHKQRLTDIPYGLREAEKERWVAEAWPYDKFPGMLSNTWGQWRNDFNDEQANPMKWGEKMRQMVANKKATEDDLRKKLYERIFSMFEDSARYGPAFALCLTRQIKVGLGKLKEQFLKEANDANHIATLLGDVYLIEAVQRGQGPTLSTILEARIGKEFEELKKATDALGLIPGRKRDRVSAEAYEYLTWCGHWCRARVEERGRRLASELAEGLFNSMDDLERQLLNYAGTLARLQLDLVKLAEAWKQKALETENIGELLYNPVLLEALKVKIAERQKDLFDPGKVAQKALERAGLKLRQLRQDAAPRLLEAVLEEARVAIGDIDEKTLKETHFAAYDLLSAQLADDNELDRALLKTTQSGAPFIRLNSDPPGGEWYDTELHKEQIAGLRGGDLGIQNDTDRERVRIVESLKRLEWNPANQLRSIDDSSQIIFFQECGGFPLRALTGIEIMKQAYQEHRSKKGSNPLHIIRDEMAGRFPDIFPPNKDDLEAALLIKDVGIPLNFIKQTTFPHPDGGGRTITKYAFSRYLPTTKEWEPVDLGDTPESLVVELAYNTEQLKEISQAIDARMTGATEAEQAEFTQNLRDYLEKVKEEVRQESGADSGTNPAYTVIRNRVSKFMQKHGLAY